MKKDNTKNIIDAIEILINNAIKETTRIDSGIITNINNDNTYNVNVRNKTFTLYSYTPATISLNSIVKIIVPQGQMSQAFIIGTMNKG